MCTTALGIGSMAAAAVAAPPAGAAAGGYDYVVIADTADGFQRDQFACPALNNAGAVAFRARSTDGEFLVLRGEGGALTTIADASSGMGVPGSPSINNSGQVAFHAALSDGTDEIYRGDETGLRKVATTRHRFTDLSTMASIDDAGRVAFDAQVPGRNAGLFWARSPRHEHPVYTYAKSDLRGDGDAFSGPAIGDAGVAFSSLRADDPDGVFLQTPDGELITIAETDGVVYKFRGASLNASGEVAFMAFRDPGGQAIMVGSGGPLRTVVDTLGPLPVLGSSVPSLNDLGTVAFTASTDGRDSGLYIGPDPVADRVAGPGDVLDGSRIGDVLACDEALNDAGQLAFRADLRDGRQLVVRADPA